MTGINSFWKVGVEDEESLAERQAVLVAGAPALRVLAARLELDLKAARKQAVARPDYNSPGWAFAQADLNASLRIYEQLLDRLREVCYNASL